MRNLNDLRAKDLATTEEADDLDEAVVDMSPVKEIEAAQKEVEALEAVLENWNHSMASRCTQDWDVLVIR